MDHRDAPYGSSERVSAERSDLGDWYPREQPESTNGGWYPSREPGYPPAHRQNTYGPGRHYQSPPTYQPSHQRQPHRGLDQNVVASWPRDLPAAPGTRHELPADHAVASRSNNGYWAATWAALAWYAVPLVLYTGWALLLRHSPAADCPGDGSPCTTGQSGGIGHSLNAALPQVLVSLVLSASVAPLLRWCNPLWRSITVGFLAAVIGGGIATMIFVLLSPGT